MSRFDEIVTALGRVGDADPNRYGGIDAHRASLIEGMIDAAYAKGKAEGATELAAMAARCIQDEIETGKWSGHWTNGLLHAVSIIEVAAGGTEHVRAEAGGDHADH